MNNVSKHMQFEKNKETDMLNITMHKHIPSIVTQKFFIQRARVGVAEVRTLRKYNIIPVKNMH